MNIHPLAGVIEKLRRADVHLNALYVDVGAYLKSSPYGMVAKREPEHGHGQFILKVTTPPPLRLSVIIGDVLHNIRSALDYLAHELIRCNGFSTGFQTQFPICSIERDFIIESCCRSRLAGISLSAFRRIDAFQPHQMGPDKYALHPLWHLHKLSNLDKHHALVLSAVGTRTAWQYVDRDTGKIRRTDILDALRYDGAIVGSMPASFIDEKVRIHIKGTSQVSFRDAPVTDMEVVNVLQRIREFVGALMLPQFYKFFDPLPDHLKLVTHGLPPEIVEAANRASETPPFSET